MSLFKNDIDAYAKAELKAKRNYRKFKETNKEKFQDKATFNYAKRNAIGMKISNPGTKVNNNNVSINNCFNKHKEVKTSVPIKFKLMTSSKKK